MNKPESVWSLQDAKAQLSEVIRRVQSDGQQVITVYGRKTVVVISYAEPQDTSVTGAELVNILENSPLRELGESVLKRSTTSILNRRVEF
jgi:prevent-host-death family protein